MQNKIFRQMRTCSFGFPFSRLLKSSRNLLGGVVLTCFTLNTPLWTLKEAVVFLAM